MVTSPGPKFISLRSSIIKIMRILGIVMVISFRMVGRKYDQDLPHPTSSKSIRLISSAVNPVCCSAQSTRSADTRATSFLS